MTELIAISCKKNNECRIHGNKIYGDLSSYLTISLKIRLPKDEVLTVTRLNLCTLFNIFYIISIYQNFKIYQCNLHQNYKRN